MISLKYFIFSKLDNGEAILDKDIFKLRGKESDVCTAITYIKLYNRIKKDERFFKDKKIESISRWGKLYVANTNEGSYRISKAYLEKYDIKI